MTQIRLLGAAWLVLTSVACGGAAHSAVHECSIARMVSRLGDSVALVGCAPETTLSSSHRKVFVGLMNGSPEPRFVRARLDLEDGLSFSLRTPGGDMSLLDGGHVYLWEPKDTPSLDEVLLPPGGVIGRVIDLACPAPDTGMADFEGTCVPLFEVSEGGSYQIQAEYDGWICEESPCTRPESVVDLPLRVQFHLVVRDP